MDQYTKYQFNDDGDVTDPPVIPAYETALADACAAADQAQIAVLTADYHEHRKRIADAHNKIVDDRFREDERLFAQEAQRRREDARAAEVANEEQSRRDEADRLRRQAEAPPIPQDGGGLQAHPQVPGFPSTGPEQGAEIPQDAPQVRSTLMPDHAPVTDPGYVPPQGPVD